MNCTIAGTNEQRGAPRGMSGDPRRRYVSRHGPGWRGWLMTQIDLAPGNAATRHASGCAAIVAVEGMSFLGTGHCRR